MITRRWTILGGVAALSAVTGIYFAGTYLQARAAGELAGAFAWAKKNRCLDWRLRDAMSDTVGDLRSDTSWWRNVFNDGFVTSHKDLNAAQAAVGVEKTCELYIAPYEPSVDRGVVQQGVWRFSVRKPEAAPVTPAPVAANEPRPTIPRASEAHLRPLPDLETWEREARNLCEWDKILSPTEKSGACALVDRSRARESAQQAIFFGHGLARRRPGDAVAPFRITTSSGSNYFFKLVRQHTNEEELVGFIVGGTPLETKVPSGSYELRYAAGDTWISEEEFFGPNTAFAKAESPLTFSIDGDQARGVEVQLILQRGGNLRTNPIKRSEF